MEAFGGNFLEGNAAVEKGIFTGRNSPNKNISDKRFRLLARKHFIRR